MIEIEFLNMPEERQPRLEVNQFQMRVLEKKWLEKVLKKDSFLEGDKQALFIEVKHFLAIHGRNYFI